jgi:chloramphenicol 3-O phosphotransferase
MGVQIIVLNGGSSAGKTTIARCLQGLLIPPWLLFGVDDLVEAIPQQGIEDGSLLSFGPDGQVAVGPGWRDVERSWFEGIKAVAESGTGVIIDEVLLDGGQGQRRLQGMLPDLNVLWVGVTCEAEVAEAREALRGDRVPGMARAQATLVHTNMVYDVVVDTSDQTADACAEIIYAQLSTDT